MIFPDANSNFWGLGNCDSCLKSSRKDTGGLLARRLISRRIKWTPLRRTNAIDYAPVLFGIYGGVIYHHGCGSRRMHIAVHKHACHGSKRLQRKLARIYKIMSDCIFRQLSTSESFFSKFELLPVSNNYNAFVHPQLNGLGEVG